MQKQEQEQVVGNEVDSPQDSGQEHEAPSFPCTKDIPMM
jgi:hypothetical protein